MVARKTQKAQRGAVVIEFALVFVLFFLVMYGIVAYGVIFAVKHSLVQAANEGARAAVRDVNDRAGAAEAVARDSLSWLGNRAPSPVVTAGNCTYPCLEVMVVYDYASNPIVPALPGLGIILPDQLVGRATVMLEN
ncbi:MAG: TadE/TadG family type IV pilus assembly protein [Thiohalomonadaceae bacterium]